MNTLHSSLFTPPLIALLLCALSASAAEVKWLGSVMTASNQSCGGYKMTIPEEQIGLRDDGVVVWRNPNARLWVTNYDSLRTFYVTNDTKPYSNSPSVRLVDWGRSELVTNWTIKSRTYPNCDQPGCLVYHTPELNESGVILSNLIYTLDLNGKKIPVTVISVEVGKTSRSRPLFEYSPKKP